jgi:putative hemolysin
MLILASCSTPAIQESMPNPASVYCEEQGNTLEIQTAEDGSQSGICIFPDGSSCEEWAYFRGECRPAVQESPTPAVLQSPTTEVAVEAATEGSGGYMEPGTSEEFSDWWGVIKSTDPGSQYDDYFERQDIAQSIITFGIDSMDPEVKAQIESLRDSGKIIHLYGTLFSNVPDYNGSQVLVDRIEVEE